MNKTIANLREEAVKKITALLNKYKTDTFEMVDISPSDTPIVHDASDGNLIFTLDRVGLDKNGILYFDSSSCWENNTEPATFLDVETLVGIAEWLEKKEPEIYDAYYEPETKSSLESDEIYVCDSHGNLGVQKVDWR